MNTLIEPKTMNRPLIASPQSKADSIYYEFFTLAAIGPEPDRIALNHSLIHVRGILRELPKNSPDHTIEDARRLYEAVEQCLLRRNKVEVRIIEAHGNLKGNGSDTFWYEFASNKPLTQDQLEIIRQAIEDADI